jgi:hypothetical protein
MTLTDCSGDINHFDVTTMRNQTNYAEALRIGRGYGGEFVARLEIFSGDQIPQFLIDQFPFQLTRIMFCR